MKILILGYSDLVQRKIIPAIKKFKNIKFDVASLSKNENKTGHDKWYTNYSSAINKSNAEVVYISLVNSKHYKYALKALNKNKNVIIDKPICLRLSDTKKLLEIAKEKNLLLAEALVFSYHQQFKIIEKNIKRDQILIKNIIMQFCIPKPPKNNFKLSKKFGGGCFNDMAPYAAAIVRTFFNSRPIYYNHVAKNINGVNESFNLSVHSKNTNFFGIFSHNSEYKNDITLISKNYIFSAERFSAPPTTIKLPVIIKKMNKIKEIKVKKDDTFYNFLKEYFQKLKERNILYYHNRILHDIYFIHKLQKKRKLI